MRITILLLFINFCSIIGQSIEPTGDSHFELFFGTVNCNGETNNFRVTEQTGVRWDVDYNLTDDYSEGTIQIEGNTDPEYYFNGFDFLRYSGNTYEELGDYGGILAYGKYLVKNEESGEYFYIDYRDCRYWGSYVEDFPYSIDLFIQFNRISNEFKFANKNDEDVGNFHQVELGETITVWEDFFDLSNPDRKLDCYELYLTLSNQNGHPKLDWNPYHDSNIEGYNLYKKLTTSSGTKNYTIFTTETSYLDESFTIDPKFGEDAVEYWVRAKINSNSESLAGNHIVIDGNSIIQWKDDAKTENSKNRKTFKLLNNYPNPFNPATTITYTIPEKQNVKICVYDPFGREVAELVNEVKAKGEHSVNFDGSNLASGVYYYTITAGNYTETKKLMLIK